MGYTVTVVCRGTEEARVRTVLLQGLGGLELHLQGLDSTNIEDSDRVEITADLTANRQANAEVERVVWAD